jgi:hypothetical protein
VRCRTAQLALSIFSELGPKSPFLDADLETRSAPLPVMANGGDHGKLPCGGSPSHDGCQLPSHRARADDSSNRALPLDRWVFTLCRHLPGLTSCCDASLCLLIGVGLRLLQMWWPSSCRGNSLPGRGSWTTGKAPSLRGRMDWLTHNEWGVARLGWLKGQGG